MPQFVQMQALFFNNSHQIQGCMPSGGAASRAPTHSHVALAASDALWAALTDEEHCKHVLLDSHSALKKMEALTEANNVHAALRSLKKHKTAQLALGACLARLCQQVQCVVVVIAVFVAK